MAGRIVVGFSGDEGDGASLTWALEYASPLKLDIELLHVVDDSWGAIPANLTETALLQAEHQLREIAERAGEGAPGLRFHPVVTLGSPTEELAIRSVGATLLVVGTHARGRIDERLFGTRAAQVASRAACSVVIVAERDEPVGSGVVVGVDGSVASLAAVEFAARFADHHGERLTAIYAWNPPHPWHGAEPYFEWPTTPSDDDHMILAESVAGISEKYPDLELDLQVASSLPADALRDGAAGARLLVVGTHGRHGLQKFWLGSVSRDIAQLMPCPIAIIRPVEDVESVD